MEQSNVPFFFKSIKRVMVVYELKKLCFPVHQFASFLGELSHGGGYSSSMANKELSARSLIAFHLETSLRTQTFFTLICKSENVL